MINNSNKSGITEELRFRDYPTFSVIDYPYPENYPLNQYGGDSIGWSIFAKDNSTGDFFVSEYIGNDTYNDYFQITRDGKVRILENDFFVDNGKADVEFDIISNTGDLKILNGSGFISTENYIFNTSSTKGSLYVENDIVTEKGNVEAQDGFITVKSSGYVFNTSSTKGSLYVENDIVTEKGNVEAQDGSIYIKSDTYTFNTTSPTPEGTLRAENNIVTETGNVVILNGDVILNGNSLLSIINDLTSRIESQENTP